LHFSRSTLLSHTCLSPSTVRSLPQKPSTNLTSTTSSYLQLLQGLSVLLVVVAGLILQADQCTTC